jgi:DNA-binding beta-propeller fold protein YncE
VRLVRAMLVAGMLLVLAGCPADEEEQARPEETPPETPSTPEGAPEPDPDPEREGEAAERLAWVGVEAGEQFVLVDLDSAEVIERHVTPGGPHNVTVSEDGVAAGALYQGTELAIAAGEDIRFVELGDSPHDVKSTDGLFVVANEVGERLDLVSHDGEHLASIGIDGQPHDTAVSPDGATAWVTINQTDELAVVDLEAGQVVRRVPTGQSPHNVLFAPDGETLWVTDWRGAVHAFDAEGGLIATLPVGEEAHHLAFPPEGGEVWVTDHHTREVIVIDTEAHEVIERIAVPGSPHHVHMTSDGELAAVADHTNGTLVVFEVGTREEVATIEVGPGPHGVWTVPH